MRLLIVSFALFIASHTQAFTLGTSTDSNMKGWNTKNLKFVYNGTNCPNSDDVKAILGDAMEVWNRVVYSNLEISYGGESTSTAYGDPPVIYCDTNFSANTGSDGDWVGGVGQFQTLNSRIVSGKIILNAESGKNARISNLTRTQLTALISHEMGHVFGLGHSEDSAALMYYAGAGRTAMNVTQDDIDGISYLYPRDELGGDQMLGCGLVSSPPDHSAGRGLLTWLLLLLPIVVFAFLRQIQKLNLSLNDR